MGKKSQAKGTSSNTSSDEPIRRGEEGWTPKWRAHMKALRDEQEAHWAAIERRQAEDREKEQAQLSMPWLGSTPPAPPEQLLSTPPPDETPEQRVRRLAGEVFRLHRALERKIPERNKALLAFQAQTGKSYQQVAEIAHMSKTTTFRIINDIRVGSDEPF